MLPVGVEGISVVSGVAATLRLRSGRASSRLLVSRLRVCCWSPGRCLRALRPTAQESDGVTTVAVRVLEAVRDRRRRRRTPGLQRQPGPRGLPGSPTLESSSWSWTTSVSRSTRSYAGDVDAAIGAISITADREAIASTSASRCSTRGSQIADSEHDVRAPRSKRPLVGQVFQPFLAVLVAVMLLGTLLVGAVVWLIERHRNPDFQERKDGGEPSTRSGGRA